MIDRQKDRQAGRQGHRKLSSRWTDAQEMKKQMDKKNKQKDNTD